MPKVESVFVTLDIRESDRLMPQQGKLNFFCTNAQVELRLSSAASTEDTKTSLWPCSVFPWFLPSAPCFLKLSLAETPLPSISGCQVQGVPVRKGMMRQGLSLQLLVWVSWSWQGWWGGCSASVSSQSREDLLSSSSEQFHGSRFLPPGAPLSCSYFVTAMQYRAWKPSEDHHRPQQHFLHHVHG